MNRVLRAYDRNITFYVLEKVVNFTIPIYTPLGDEYQIHCSFLKDKPEQLHYNVVKTPMSLWIEVPPAENHNASDKPR